MKNLTIIIPVFNEAESLESILPAFLDFCRESETKLILVDDGSTDDSYKALERASSDTSVSLIHHKVNRGYGGALKSGIAACKTEYCVTVDADGQHSLEDLASLYEQITQNDGDLVVGSRNTFEGEETIRKIGKAIIRTFAKILLPIHIRDINSGMKMYQTDIVKRYLDLCPDSMAFSDIITLTFIQQRHLVLEYPITVQARTGGTSTINLKTAIDTVMELLNIVVLFNPMRIFLPVSLILMTGSLLWGIPILMGGRGVSVGSMMGIISGLIFFFLGLMAEQFSQLRRSMVLSGKGSSSDRED